MMLIFEPMRIAILRSMISDSIQINFTTVRSKITTQLFTVITVVEDLLSEILVFVKVFPLTIIVCVFLK